MASANNDAVSVITGKRGPVGLSKNEKIRIGQEMLNGTQSTRQIKNKYGVSYNTVYAWRNLAKTAAQGTSEGVHELPKNRLTFTVPEAKGSDPNAAYTVEISRNGKVVFYMDTSAL